jgi:HEAT repeat protein
VADAIFEIRDCPIPLLREGAGSASVAMRAVSVELLGRFQALAAADDVVGILRTDPSPEVRARAARCLGRMGSPRAVEPLLACLDGSPAAVRIQALWALGQIGAPEALPVLRATLLSPSRQLSEVAAAALAALGPPGLRLLEHVADGRGQAADAAAAVLADRAGLESSSL